MCSCWIKGGARAGKGDMYEEEAGGFGTDIQEQEVGNVVGLQLDGLNQMENCIKRNTLIVGSFEIPLPPPEPKYATIMIGTIPIKYEVT